MAIPSTLASIEAQARRTIQTLFSYLDAQGQGDYLGEAISQLKHSLQAAGLAKDAGSDDETVIATLLHDVGRFIPSANDMPKIALDDTFIGPQSHEITGEEYLRGLGFSDKVCSIVGADAWTMRYLCATEEGYWDSLSKTSKVILELQVGWGGVFKPEKVREAQKDPLLEQKLAVRRWIDLAKVPDKQVLGLDAYEDMAVGCLIDVQSHIELHGKKYALPRRPTVVVCVDGFDPEYLDHGIEHGLMPNCKNYLQNGFHVTGNSAMPSLTNPNNTSIITGVPTAVHGISGNFFLDRETRKENMITDDSLLRGSTILSEMSKRGIRVAAVTAKDKLRKILHHDIKDGICFSSQRASKCTLDENGIENVEEWIGRPAPSQYSADLSIYVLDAGIKLLEEQRADLLYLTLSDYVQHLYAPGDKESNDFMAALDERFGKLVELDAVLGITADHGMSDKSKDDGSPNVLFLQDELEKSFGDGCARVICPIADPFVKHHGALGSFVRVYVWEKDKIDCIIEFCKARPEVELALGGSDGAALFEMPLDREGDIVVVSKANAVIGAKESEHDLSQLRDHRLRSHGGLSEQPLPLIMSTPVAKPEAAARKSWRNYDIFDLVLNWQA